MPSRKRNKGKERKAKKAELEAEKIEKERAAVRSVWVNYARGEVKVRQITQCNHGIDLVIPDEDNHPVTNFIDGMVLYDANNSNLHMRQYLRDTFVTHQEVWDNERYREMAVNILISIGANSMLSSDLGTCFFLTYAVLVLENYDGEGIISIINSRVVATKVRDLGYADTSVRRDVLKFYRKRTTCSCLKKMHLDARKALPKVGICMNCQQVKERALLMVCSRCRIAQYCSRECQVASWPKHKCDCGLYVESQQK